MENRVIKFRAWDKSRMIFFSDFSIGLPKTKKLKPYVFFVTDTFDGEVSLHSHEIMQYTNLDDSHGIEVYESDILFNSDTKYYCVVKMIDGCWKVIYAANTVNAKQSATYIM